MKEDRQRAISISVTDVLIQRLEFIKVQLGIKTRSGAVAQAINDEYFALRRAAKEDAEL